MTTHDKYNEEFLRHEYLTLNKDCVKISIEHKLNLRSLYRHIKKYNIPLRRENLGDKLEEIKKLHSEGLFLVEIADILGIKMAYVAKRLSGLPKNGRYKHILTKDFLTENYLEKCLSLKEIAEIANCTECTVGNFIKKHGLTKNKNIRQELDREKLYDLYINENMSVYNIAKSHGLKYAHTISKMLEEYNIPLWPKGHIFKAREDSLRRIKKHKHLSRSMLSKIKHGAKIRNLEFNIDMDDIWDKYVSQNKKCALSGVDITLPNNSFDYKNYNYSGSVDRIDSSLGYTVENIQIVHKELNLMKQAMSDDYFIKWCTIICDYNRRKK